MQKQIERDLIILSLSGRIEQAGLADLEKAMISETRNGNVVLDLSNVRLVDQAAVKFLARFEASGLRLRDCPTYIREWIARERQKQHD